MPVLTILWRNSFVNLQEFSLGMHEEPMSDFIINNKKNKVPRAGISIWAKYNAFCSCCVRRKGFSPGGLCGMPVQTIRKFSQWRKSITNIT